jgi:hypothetical protein
VTEVQILIDVFFVFLQFTSLMWMAPQTILIAVVAAVLLRRLRWIWLTSFSSAGLWIIGDCTLSWDPWGYCRIWSALSMTLLLPSLSEIFLRLVEMLAFWSILYGIFLAFIGFFYVLKLLSLGGGGRLIAAIRDQSGHKAAR